LKTKAIPVYHDYPGRFERTEIYLSLILLRIKYAFKINKVKATISLTIMLILTCFVLATIYSILMNWIIYPFFGHFLSRRQYKTVKNSDPDATSDSIKDPELGNAKII
jgi:hypothetical protein